VLYTLTNSLTGAGVSKYVVPALGLIIGLFLLNQNLFRPALYE
jgi:phosphoglycerol transferase